MTELGANGSVMRSDRGNGTVGWGLAGRECRRRGHRDLPLRRLL